MQNSPFSGSPVPLDELALRQWLGEQWDYWARQDVFALLPVRRTYAEQVQSSFPWGCCYLGLFPREPFLNFYHFLAYERFFASAMQTMIRDTPPDEDWFVLFDRGEYVDEVAQFLLSLEGVAGPDAIAQWLAKWQWPEPLAWIHALDHQQAIWRDIPVGPGGQIELWGETKQGYVLFLNIDG